MNKFVLIIILIDILFGYCHVHYSRDHFSQIIDHTHEDQTKSSPRSDNHDKFSDSVPVNVEPCSICPQNGICVPNVQCPAHVLQKNVVECDLHGDSVGVCCTTGQSHSGQLADLKTRASLAHINNEMLNIAIKLSKTDLHELLEHENKLLTGIKDTIISRESSTYGHHRNFMIPRHTDLSETISLTRRALEIALATKALKEREGVSNRQIELGLLNTKTVRSSLGNKCARDVNCWSSHEIYRTIDGSCNNLQNPTWGLLRTPFSRVLPPYYEDGVMVPRISTDGKPLTSARIISDILITDLDRPHSAYTLMTMQFGQLLSHDLTRTVQHMFPNGSGISCCTPNEQNELPAQFRHFACMPILISPEDSFFRFFKKGCMNFVRSMLAPREDCTFGFSNQMNKATHFLDGSFIYGSDTDKLSEIRSFQDGRLNVFRDFGRDLPPLSKNPNDCIINQNGFACFAAGDARCNQIISLTTLHGLFIREHNRIANELSILNPHWNDEILFMETRRIVVAELQHIVYNEWLPLIIGEKAMDRFNLRPVPFGYSSDYDQRINPSITNEFATAAFRLHTTVNGRMSIVDKKQLEEVIEISEVMFNPTRLRFRKFFDEMLNTLTSQPMQEFDVSISESLTHYMFRDGNPFGFDIASLNIQRGRDHGLRPYNDYRELVGLQKISAWEEYIPEIADKLRQVYASPDDMDLWVGGILETPEPGALVGATFRDIIADQFSRLRKGDRYFYEHDPSINPGHFSLDQLHEIKKATLSRIICDNSDGILIEKQTPNAFILPGLFSNNYVDCQSSSIPHINLFFWKQQ